ncbi:MAG: hypothetical protein K1X94_28010 [Sandaracinaceae bacterium]|nr:hypothetical protein [Sandaracinaceae bacterium]
MSEEETRPAEAGERRGTSEEITESPRSPAGGIVIFVLLLVGLLVLARLGAD